jgi:hypothetical protein
MLLDDFLPQALARSNQFELKIRIFWQHILQRKFGYQSTLAVKPRSLH